MLEILITILFCWLFFKAAGLIFKVAWSAAKIIATVMLVVACPLLAICLLFVGGLAVLIPVALIAAASGILKACV